MKKSRLQRLLSTIEPLSDRSPALEQYPTPPDIAASVLNRATLNEEIDGKEVADLGCGSGILALGAALLGAATTGYDMDEDAVKTARKNAERLAEETDKELDARFTVADVRDISGSFHTVVMNPPFGIQREGENLVFVETAIELAPVAYALLHRSREKTDRTHQYIKDFAAESGAETRVLETYDFPLPRAFSFHTSEKEHINVDLYRFERR